MHLPQTIYPIAYISQPLTLHHSSLDTSHFRVFLIIIAAPLRSLTKLLASAAAAAVETLVTE